MNDHRSERKFTRDMSDEERVTIDKFSQFAADLFPPRFTDPAKEQGWRLESVNFTWISKLTPVEGEEDKKPPMPPEEEQKKK